MSDPSFPRKAERLLEAPGAETHFRDSVLGDLAESLESGSNGMGHGLLADGTTGRACVSPLSPFRVYRCARVGRATLEVVGIDIQMSGSGAADSFVSDLEDVLNRGESGLPHTSGWPEFRRLLQDAVTDVWWKLKPSAEVRTAFDSMFAQGDRRL